MTVPDRIIWVGSIFTWNLSTFSFRHLAVHFGLGRDGFRVDRLASLDHVNGRAFRSRDTASTLGSTRQTVQGANEIIHVGRRPRTGGSALETEAFAVAGAKDLGSHDTTITAVQTNHATLILRLVGGATYTTRFHSHGATRAASNA